MFGSFLPAPCHMDKIRSFGKSLVHHFLCLLNELPKMESKRVFPHAPRIYNLLWGARPLSSHLDLSPPSLLFGFLALSNICPFGVWPDSRLWESKPLFCITESLNAPCWELDGFLQQPLPPTILIHSWALYMDRVLEYARSIIYR